MFGLEGKRTKAFNTVCRGVLGKSTHVTLPDGEHVVSLFVINQLKKGEDFERMLYSLTKLFDGMIQVGIASPVRQIYS